MLHKRLKKRLASCLCAVLAVTCILSSIPVQAQSRSQGSGGKVNWASGLTYETNWTNEEFNSDTYSDYDHVKMTDGAKANSIWAAECAGFKKRDSNEPVTFTFDLGEKREVNEVNFSGWDGNQSGVRNPSHFKVEYTDDNGDWQLFYEGDIGRASPEGAEVAYQYGYEMPDNGSVTTQNIRLSLTLDVNSGVAFLDEIEILSPADESTEEPEEPVNPDVEFVNVALGASYTSEKEEYFETWTDDGTKLTDGQKGNGNKDAAYVGYAFTNSDTVTETDRPWDWVVDLNGVKEINSISVSGWANYAEWNYQPKFYNFYYTDENGEEQEFYLFPEDNTGLGYDNQTYTMSYALPNNETVKASSVRISMQPYSTRLFLDEIEVMGINDGSIGSSDLPDPPAENVEVVSSGLRYNSNYSEFAAGYADNARIKLTNGIVATEMEDTSNNVAFNVTADKPLQLTFKLSETKDFKAATICGWSDSVAPSYTVAYRNPDTTWTSLTTEQANTGRYTVSSVIAGDYTAATDEIQVTLSVTEDTVVYLDEILIYAAKEEEPSTIDPNNIIGGLPYKTNLLDGNANAGEGDYHPDHADVDRVRLTDGKKAPSKSTWENENTVGLHTPTADVPHDDPDEKRILLEFNLDEPKSFEQISFNGFMSADVGIVFPSHLTIEYKNGDADWQTLYDKDINAPASSMYRFTYLVPGDEPMTITDIRFIYSCTNDHGWVFLDELEVLENADTSISNLNPEASKAHNLLSGIPYTTTLQDGDANAGTGDFHGSHPDPDRKLLTDGLYSSGYEDPNGVYFNARDSLYTIPADVVFDLGESKTFEEISISTVGNTYIYLPAKTVIKISDDQENWRTIYSGDWSGEANDVSKEFILTAVEGEPITARYISFDFYHRFDWMGLDEIQIFDEATGTESYGTITLKQPPLEDLRGIAPTISEDGTHIILPESTSEYFDVGLFGSDNLTVIDLDGNIYTPLVDTTVNLIYKAIDKETGEIIKGDYNVQVTVPGQYQEAAGDNEVPDTMPALREWKGSTGNFTLNDNTAIVVDASADARTREIANQIKDFFKDMLGRTVTVEQGAPVPGDIYLTLDSSIPEMGEEGYYMEVGDYVTITAYGHTGLLYGGVSATQILYSDPWHMSIPKGIARDYPMYSIRGGMIDVARAYVPMEYLQEITRYMAWFKLNEIHVHINDRGENNYAAFRLESDIPNLTSEDGYYTKDEYRAYQEDALKYGIKVVTEFDTPGHSDCFADVPGIKMLDSSHIDITDPGSVEVIKSMFDEFLGGDNPVIITDTVHIGADEYPYTTNEGEAIRQYTYDIANYVKELGYTPRFWGGLWYNSGLPNGVESNPGVQTNGWAHDTPSISELYDMDYDIVNTYNMILYSVPGGNYGFANYYDLARLYNDWNPNWYEYKGTMQVPLGHPQTLGAEFAVWNDVHTFGGGTSNFDIFQRVKYGVMLVAEKDWQGAPKEDQNYADFSRRMDLFWDKVPGANPNRFVESKGGQIIEYDFESVDGNTVKDFSGNGYDGTLNNASITDENGNHVATFDGNGYLSLPMDNVGYPFSVEFDIMLTDNSNEEATLFSSDEGTFYLNVDGTGKLGFKRDGYILKDGKAFFDPEGYTFAFDYSFPLNEWVHVKIHSESNNSYNETFLEINGQEYKAEMQNSIVDTSKTWTDTQFSTTTVLPTERIGDKMVGSIDNLNIIDTANYTRSPNLALYADATMSSRESESEMGPEMAVDGQIITDNRDRSRASFGRDEDDQWLIIDLGSVQTIDQIVLYPFEQAPEFEVLISETGNDDDWQQVFYKNTGTNGGERGQVYTIDFDPTNARYVKYHQLKRWQHESWGTYSGSISEIEVYRTAGDYDITVGYVEGGKVVPSVTTADAGEEVTLNVTPNTDYVVSSVKVNGTEVTPEDGVYRFQMPANDVIVTAEFTSNAPAVYTVDIAATVNGKVESNKRIAVEGDTVTLFVTPDEGYRAKTVQVNGTAITPVDGVYSFIMPAETASVTAEFELIPETELYNITIAPTENGTITADRTTAAEGDKVVLTVIPAEDYSIDTVTVDGAEITAVGGEYSFTMPAKDVEVAATFKQNEAEPSYTITVSNTTGGKIVPEKTTAKAGEIIRVSVTAYTNYYLDTLYCNDEELFARDGIYSFVMPAEDVVLSASFRYYGSSSGGGWTGGGSSRPSEPSEPETPAEPTWEQVDGGWKLKGADGSYLTGWQKVDGVWYYLRSNGMMVTGWFQDGSTWYYLKSNGAMATGWLKLGNVWYYLKSNGAMQTGWLYDGGVWYWLYDWGGMANTSWVKVNNTWYYFRGNGHMMTGWLQQGSTWYYLKSSGAMATGWNWVGNKCYYFYSNGKMAANTTVGGYRVNANGEWVQ